MNLATAKRVIEAGQAEARRLGIAPTIAVADTSGHLVALERMDGSPLITVEIASAKAFTAAAVGVPGKDLEAMVGQYPFFVAAAVALFHGRFLPAYGSIPIYTGSTLAGGVGVSGGAGEQDDEIAKVAASSASS